MNGINSDFVNGNTHILLQLHSAKNYLQAFFSRSELRAILLPELYYFHGPSLVTEI